MLMVCWPPLPVLWQTSTFVWPVPRSPGAAPPVVVRGAVVEIVLRAVDVWLPLSADSDSKSLSCDPCSSADWLSRSPLVVCVEVVWDPGVLVVAALGVEPAVICASPTPAAAANARPTTTPTRERRVRLLNRLRTLESLQRSEERRVGKVCRSRWAPNQ